MRIMDAMLAQNRTPSENVRLDAAEDAQRGRTPKSAVASIAGKNLGSA
jgi:hypothetical protein